MYIRNLYIILILFGVMLVLSGCNSLPDGTPPDGDIVNLTNTDQKVFTETTGREYMLLTLQTQCFELANAPQPPKVLLQITATNNKILRSMQYKLCQDLAKEQNVIPQKTVATSQYILSSEVKTKNTSNTYQWKIRLLSPDKRKEFWQEVIQFEVRRHVTP